MHATLTLLPGDGIGPEIINEARLLLEHIAQRFDHRWTLHEALLGGAAIDATGNALPDETLQRCQESDAVLLGAVGGPKWDDPNAKVRPEQGLLGIRKALGLYANLRPVQVMPEMTEASPLSPERLQGGVDLVVVRELTGGLYFGEPRFTETQADGTRRAIDTLVYTDAEIRRVMRLAFSIAQTRQKRLTSIDKANVLESSRLWRQVATEVASEFPDVQLEHQLVDSAAMRLVTSPTHFDVIVTENLFGDILSDEAAVLTGSLGILPSASLGEGRMGLYEPIHGSAPDIAGKGLANPLGMILSVALMLRHSLGLETEAKAVEQAVAAALREGARTADLDQSIAKPMLTHEMGEAVRTHLNA